MSAVLLCLLAVGCSSKEGSSGAATTENSGPAIYAQPDGGEWQPLRDAEGKFAVLLPGEATKIAGNDGEISHVVELENGGGYTVMYSTVNEVPAAEVEQGLANLQADVVGKKKLLHEDANVKVGNVPARDFAFVETDGDAHYYRLLIVGNRLYQVMTVTEGGKFDAAKADRQKFLDSFELTE
jgi:hypothetical protein